MVKRKKIITNNKEIYQKLNKLHIMSDVVLEGVKQSQINRIIKNINKNSEILSFESFGKYIVIKKKSPLNFDIYLR